MTAWTPTDLARLRGGGWSVGDLICGAYRVEAVRSGAMGVVYLCGDQAIKTVLADPLADPEARAQMEAEAHSWVGLPPHPNVVPCTLVARNPFDTRLFLFLARVRGHPRLGTTLGEWMGRGLLPRGTVTSIVAGIAEGLASAWESAGLVHRDLKPDNVLLGADGVPRVSDFGLARRLAEVKGAAGTPSYMAPEAWLGQGVSTATDVYALGVILWELLAGEHPFAEHHDAVVSLRYAHAAVEPADPRTRNRAADPALCRLALACLAKDPARRPAGFDAVLEEMGQRRRAAPAAPDAVAELNRAQGLMTLGRYAEAEAVLDRLREQPADVEIVDALRLRLLAETGRLAEDEALVLRVAERKVSDPVLLDAQSRALRLLGRREEAHAVLARALAADPRGSRAHALGILLWEMGRHEEALASLASVAEASAQVDRARLLRVLGRREEAARALNHALSLNPNDLRALLGVAEEMERLGRAADALELVARARHVAPRSPAPRRLQARLLHAVGRGREAAAALRGWLAEDPDDVEMLGELMLVLGPGEDEEWNTCVRRIGAASPTTAAGHVLRGRVALQLAFPADAAEAFGHALALDPGSVAAWEGRGDACLELGDPAGAREAYGRALVLDPGRAELQARVRAAEAAGEGQAALAADPRRALACFRRAAALDPGNAALPAFVISALLALDRHGAALQAIDALRESSPRRAQRWLLRRAFSLMQVMLRGEVDAALDEVAALPLSSADRDAAARLRALLDERRHTPPPARSDVGWEWHREGTAALRAGALDEAEEHYRRARYADPAEARHAVALGTCLFEIGRPDALAETIALLQEGCRSRPQDVAAHFNLASVLVDAGRAAEAEPILQRLYLLAPGDPDLGDLADKVGRAMQPAGRALANPSLGLHAVCEGASAAAFLEALSGFVAQTRGEEAMTWPFGLDEALSWDENSLLTGLRVAARAAAGLDAAAALTVKAEVVVSARGDARCLLLRSGKTYRLGSGGEGAPSVQTYTVEPGDVLLLSTRSAVEPLAAGLGAGLAPEEASTRLARETGAQVLLVKF